MYAFFWLLLVTTLASSVLTQSPVEIHQITSWCKSHPTPGISQNTVCWRPGYEHTVVVKLIEQELSRPFRALDRSYAIERVFLWRVPNREGGIRNAFGVQSRSVEIPYKVHGQASFKYQALFQERALTIDLPLKVKEGTYYLGITLEPSTNQGKQTYVTNNVRVLVTSTRQLKRTELAPQITKTSPHDIADELAMMIGHGLVDRDVLRRAHAFQNDAKSDHEKAMRALEQNRASLYASAENLWTNRFAEIDRHTGRADSSASTSSHRVVPMLMTKDAHDDSDPCFICLEKFKKGDVVEQLVKCGRFHGRCMGMGDLRHCPMCREELVYTSEPSGVADLKSGVDAVPLEMMKKSRAHHGSRFFCCRQ